MKNEEYWKEEYRRRVIIACHKKDLYEITWDGSRFTCSIDDKPTLALISKEVMKEIEKLKNKQSIGPSMNTENKNED